MILYHGTDYQSWLKIREGINVRINFTDDRELDFGFGFYLATNKRYAEKTAISKAKMLCSGQERGDQKENYPVVIAYDFDLPGAMAEAKERTLVFSRKDRVFLSTVFKARFNRAGVDTLHKDLIYAPISDGLLLRLMPWYKKHPCKFREYMCKLGYWLPEPGKQVIIRHERLCKYAKILSCDPVKGGRHV